MLLRKINAGLSLLITFLLLGHAISNAVWMLSMGSVAKPIAIMPWILTGLVVIHAFLSIDMAISGLFSDEKKKSKKYAKLNMPTVIQRISGVLMVVFTGLHIAGATKSMQPPQFIHAFVPTMFFTVALVHIAVSTSKAFITLGIGNAKTIKVIDISAKAICAVTLIADVIGFYLYLV